jgi:hypothetical protein
MTKYEDQRKNLILNNLLNDRFEDQREIRKKMNLKGQCHEMVVEIRPWSGRLGLN